MAGRLSIFATARDGGTLPAAPNRCSRYAAMRSVLGATLPALIAAACAAPPAEVTVRHFGSTRYLDGAQIRVFTFDPRMPRSLDERLRLARAEIARDPACRWAGASRAAIEEATRAQGAAYADTLLAAPVNCET